MPSEPQGKRSNVKVEKAEEASKKNESSLFSAVWESCRIGEVGGTRASSPKMCQKAGPKKSEFHWMPEARMKCEGDRGQKSLFCQSQLK